MSRQEIGDGGAKVREKGVAIDEEDPILGING